MIKRYFVAVAVTLPALAVGGCDRLQGDYFINLYKTEIAVAMKYDDGSIESADLLPCHIGFVGRIGPYKEELAEAASGVKIIRSGETLHHLDAEQMRRLLVQKEDYPEAAWGVGPGGIRLETDLDTPAPECADNALPLFHRELRVDMSEEELTGEMVLIPGGAFQMGDLSGEGWSDEKPVHNVAVPAFMLGKYEVSFVQWAACVAAGACNKKRGENRRRTRPVLDVSWDEAQDFIRWLNARTGGGYRLPTEAEWEYAARAGTTTEYFWGNGIGRNHANCYECGNVWRRTATPLGTFAANGWGLHDMHGNVWEWVQDCWNGNYQGAPNDGGAWTSGDCSRRVVRGGSHAGAPHTLRSAFRASGSRSSGQPFKPGFRLAQDL